LAASVGDLFAFLIHKNFFVDFKLPDQALNFLHGDLAANNQAKLASLASNSVVNSRFPA
jgi:hypothetical protein